MTLPFELPPTSPELPAPIWKENAFYIGKKKVNVLQYSQNFDGWNTELTQLHEEHTGKTHFIDMASRKQAIQQLQQHLPQSEAVILEIGCSSGFMLQDLEENLPSSHIILGADVVYEPLLKLSEELPEIPLFQFDLTCCPLPDNSIDVIILLNVLEHIENDALALQQIYRILKKGGLLIIEVPAGPNLYDIYDKMLMHYRRYTLRHLEKKISNAQFDILKKSHLGVFIYPAFWLTKQWNKIRYHENNIPPVKAHKVLEKNMTHMAQNTFMHKIMDLELALGTNTNYPFGTRCIMTCQKK